jgi:hypothetical protein
MFRKFIAGFTSISLWACVIGLGYPLTACSGVTVAQDIVNWTPALQSAVQTINGTAALLAPADAPIFTAATVGFDAASNLLVAQAKAYLANPSASILVQLQNAVLAFQSSVNASVLAAAKITNSASQASALNAINGVATIVTAILALVSSIKGSTLTPASVKAPQLAQVEPLLDRQQSVAIVAEHYGISSQEAAVRVSLAENRLISQGF